VLGDHVAGLRDRAPYAVDVTVSSHDELKRGVVERAWLRVLISADEVHSDQEAVLLAAQMAHATEGYVTSARLVSWPE
jgi:hypothetical protein